MLRSWNVAACLIAVLAMFASAASACACNHHQPQVKAEEKPSCHPPSHAEPAAETEEAVDFDTFRLGCSCFVGTRILAIMVKSEIKKFSSDRIAAADEVPVQKVPVAYRAAAGSAEIGTPVLDHSNVLPPAGPSRAPPRL